MHLFLIVRTFLVEAFRIPTGSMESTLQAGDFLLVNRAGYGARVPFTRARTPAVAEPARGEIVVFLPPHEPGNNYVKRRVGMPGDTLEPRPLIAFMAS
ncbi:MAG: signal peptidase I [Longimicrobiales bacterium]